MYRLHTQYVTPLFSEYIPDNSADTEPDFQYTPDSYSVTSPLPPGGDPLAGSLSLLQEGLDGGATLTQFEVSADAEHCYAHVSQALPYPRCRVCCSNCTGRNLV